ELIIYKYGCESEESIKNQFIRACIRHKNVVEADVEAVKQHIYVVTFEKNDTYFLGLEEKEYKLI
ncbi:MAG: ABC transporter permease, partial [Acetatifactor sp.]|nr:ABC transporter permease [Acetatifactor sp.]